MGKLIKNHWARLIIMTAAACKWTRFILNMICTELTSYFFRPNCCGHRSLYLAQDLLGFPYDDAGRRCQADTGPPDNQSVARVVHAGSGVASGLYRGLCSAPLARGPAGHPATDGPDLGITVPGHEPCHLLHDWDGGVLCGLQ